MLSPLFIIRKLYHFIVKKQVQYVTQASINRNLSFQVGFSLTLQFKAMLHRNSTLNNRIAAIGIINHICVRYAKMI